MGSAIRRLAEPVQHLFSWATGSGFGQLRSSMPYAGPIAAEHHGVLMPTTNATLADLAKEYDKSQG